MLAVNRFEVKVVRFDDDIESKEIERYIEKLSTYDLILETVNNTNFKRLKHLLLRVIPRNENNIKQAFECLFISTHNLSIDGFLIFKILYYFCFPILDKESKINGKTLLEYVAIHHNVSAMIFLIHENHKISLINSNNFDLYITEFLMKKYIENIKEPNIIIEDSDVKKIKWNKKSIQYHNEFNKNTLFSGEFAPTGKAIYDEIIIQWYTYLGLTYISMTPKYSDKPVIKLITISV